MTKQTAINESGRSMVEMLGVLAIAGILSIVGIAGFRYAMNKHYTNEIINEVNKHAYLCSADLLLNKNNASLKDNFALTSPTTRDVEYALKLYEGEDFFAIQVSKIEQNICKQIVAAGNKIPYETVDECESANKITFYYRTDMSECTDPETCIVPEECEDESKQCGYKCCGDAEHCIAKQCCPQLKYIAAEYNYDETGELCCEGDEIAVPVGETGKYTCKTPEKDDNCLDKATNMPDQSKCNKDGEEKLYCKVTSFSGPNNCKVPSAATCQPIPNLTTKKVASRKAGEAKEYSLLEGWANYWSADAICQAKGMRLMTDADYLCGNSTSAASSSYGMKRIAGNDTWWGNLNNCQAHCWHHGSLYDQSKTSNYRFYCMPNDYECPSCPAGQVYNVGSNTCEQ